MSKTANKIKPINYIQFAILVLILIGLITLYFVLRPKRIENKAKNYTTLNLSSFKNNYEYGKDFEFTNDLNLDVNSLKSEAYRVTPNLLIDKSTIKVKANQMGLNFEQANLFDKVYYWYKESINQGDFITLNEKELKFRLSYSAGIGTENISNENAYNFVKEYFKLNISDATLVTSDIKANSSTQNLRFNYKFNDLQIYQTDAEPKFATIILQNGKVVFADIDLLPNNFQSIGELQPINLISSSNFPIMNYQMNFENLYTSNGSDYDFYVPVGQDTNVTMKSYKPSLYHYSDSTGIYLLPAIEINGNYIDNKNNIGAVKILVINQAPK